MGQNNESIDIFPYRLKEARKKANFTQKQLGEKIDVSGETISNYESPSPFKHKNPSLNNAIDLAKTLRTSLDWLCGLPYGLDTLPVEALLIVLDRFKPEITIGEGTTTPYVTLSFNIDSPDISAHELKSFISQYQLIQPLINIDNEYSSDTKKTVDVIRKHLIERYKHLPELPDYTFIKEFE